MTKQSFVTYALLCASILLAQSCKKTEGTSSNPTIPVLTTTASAAVSSSSIQSGGDISSDGGSSITARGVKWVRDGQYEVSTDTTNNGTGKGIFTSTITGLRSNSTYYVKSYATNSVGTAYGNEVRVSTAPGPPVMHTDSLYEDNHVWTSRGRVEEEGGAPVTTYGFCWSTHPHPTLADTRVEGIGTIAVFRSMPFQLPAKSTIYYRSYGTNSYGTGYGNEISLTTNIGVGLYYQGGVIYSVDASGQHGLIAALVNQSNSAQWHYIANYNTNARSTTDGAANTDRIIATLPTGSYAPNLCRDYRGGGYSDWFLPASQQIYFMDLSGVIPDFPGYVSSSGTVFYWTSTEFNTGEAIIRLCYSTTHFSTSESKTHFGKVRAIRAF